MQITPRDLYRLRHARLLAQRADLRAQFARQQLQEISLDLERRYGVLTTEAVLDIETGVITAAPSTNNESQPHTPTNPKPV